MEQIDNALRDADLYGNKNLTRKEFVYNARLAAKKVHEAAVHFGGEGSEVGRLALNLAVALAAYADGIENLKQEVV